MKRCLMAILVLVSLIPVPALAERYFAFSADQMEFQGEQRIFYVPFSFDGPTEKSIERKVGVLFEKLHGPRAAIYGETYLIVKAAQDGQYEAYLMLDPETTRFHEIISGEIYLTLTNVGITRLFVGPEKRKYSDTDLRYPFFLPTVPLWEALPPAQFQHALIRMGDADYMESATFNTKLAAKDAALYGKILALLGTKDSYVKLQVLKAFPLLGVAQSEKYLLPLLTDPDVVVQHRIIELLKDRKEPVVLDALAKLADGDKNPETQLRAAKILVANGRSSYQIYILFDDLKSQDPKVVSATLVKLAASNDKRVLPAIIRMLGHPDPEVRSTAMAGMKQLKDLEALKLLINTQEVLPEYRKEAALELMRQSDANYSKEGIKYVLVNLNGKEAEEAVATIEMRKFKDMAQDLVKALGHGDVPVAQAAVKAIGNLDLIEKIGDLAEAAGRTELTETVRDTIAKMMSRQQPDKVIEWAGSKNMVIRELAVLSLIDIAKARKGGKILDAVLETLDARMRDKNDVIKRAAAKALFEIGGVDNWTRVLRAKKDDDPQMRLMALAAAAALKSPEGDSAIVAFMEDPDDDVRVASLVQVRERKLKDGRARLKTMVMSPKQKEKAEAIKAVAVLNETEAEHREFFDLYARGLFDQDPEVQLASVQGIQWIIDPKVVPLLQSGILLNHKDPRVRAAALIALGRSKDHNTVEDIARGFVDQEKIVQAAAIEGLRLLGHNKALKPLQEFFNYTDDPELKAAAQKAVEEIQNKPKGIL